MKKTLLILSSISLGIMSGSAQITITSADVAIPGHVIYRTTDTSYNAFSMGPGGANQTWNFSSLTQPVNDTLSFLAYGWAPNAHFSAASVSNADSSGLVAKVGYQTTYSYMVNATTSLHTLGNYAMLTPPGGTPVPANQINYPAEKLMEFPATYNTTYTNNYTSKAIFYVGQTISSIPVDSARQKSIVRKTVTIDGWGMLNTPLGTYNVIRSKETKISIDSLFAYIVIGTGSWNNIPQGNSADSTTLYVFWANGIGFPLATATMDSAGNEKSIQWLKTLPAAGINELAAASHENVFPNPAQNEINFVADAATQKAIQVYDVTGRLIETININNNQTTINTSAYANGLYTYSITGKNNLLINRGKFTISK